MTKDEAIQLVYTRMVQPRSMQVLQPSIPLFTKGESILYEKVIDRTKFRPDEWRTRSVEDSYCPSSPKSLAYAAHLSLETEERYMKHLIERKLVEPITYTTKKGKSRVGYRATPTPLLEFPLASKKPPKSNAERQKAYRQRKAEELLALQLQLRLERSKVEAEVETEMEVAVV